MMHLTLFALLLLLETSFIVQTEGLAPGVVFNSTTCLDEGLQVTCIVHQAPIFVLMAPPYVDDSNKIEFNLGSSQAQRTVNDVSFVAQLVKAEAILNTPLANFEVLLTVVPPVNPLTVQCGSNNDVVTETISLRGPPDSANMTIENSLPTFTYGGGGAYMLELNFSEVGVRNYSALVTVEDECGITVTDFQFTLQSSTDNSTVCEDNNDNKATDNSTMCEDDNDKDKISTGAAIGIGIAIGIGGTLGMIVGAIIAVWCIYKCYKYCSK